MKNFAGRIVLALMILALAWGVVQLTRYATLQYSLRSKIANLRADGYPVSITELQRIDRSQSEAVGEIIAMRAALDKLQRSLAAVPQSSTPSAADVRAKHVVFRAFTTEHPDVIEKLRDAAAKPIGGSRCDFSLPADQFLQSLLDQMGSYQLALRTLAMDGEIQLSIDDPNEAARDAIALMQWGEHAAAEPGLTFYLKSLGIRSQAMLLAAKVLDADHVSDDLRKSLLRMIRDHDAVATWSAALASERAISISLSNDFGPTGSLPMMLRDRRMYLDMMEEYQAAAAAPWGLTRTSAIHSTGILTGLVGKSIESAFQSFRRNQALARTLLVLNAWQQAGRQTPVDLKVLSLDAARFVDPFDGDTLRVHVNGSNVVFYSVGINLRDDRGNLGNELDVGVSAALPDEREPRNRKSD